MVTTSIASGKDMRIGTSLTTDLATIRELSKKWMSTETIPMLGYTSLKNHNGSCLMSGP